MTVGQHKYYKTFSPQFINIQLAKNRHLKCLNNIYHVMSNGLQLSLQLPGPPGLTSTLAQALQAE